ncbi:malectin domain-containing carbohydrate-binding protein [Bacteroides sp. SL.2.06]|uniref:glycoside hydrolase family 2 TIM barrel-domain containing protein n=1 Tax=Bacteroides TaxID=816 RepID=UPI00210C623D|nr:MULTISPECIES: glycoside hydrolase family 2 TIM barrel-domain containing protein [Bacteroides]MCQ4809018.1 malectin domain-containing carbohydrate-binding protein [Bacteroides sp. SL.2.06]MCS2623803.1 malectin domain-containing carbohydrate-binding protein [Bacteroides xylanisolvens]MCS2980206.1 malectin domain-containing carbohydrate-binding protein [Bacteroides xylanisolvens]
MKKLFYIFILLFIVGWAQAQQRVVYTINDGWKFTKGSPFEAQLTGCDDSSWETVNIPHTWNDKDADDETPGFYRGPVWYRKQLFIDKSQEGRQAVIYFEGANQEVRFYLNGRFVGEHKGGYTRFCFDITPHLRYGQENLFAIYVNNVYNPNIPPLSADFTFFGGIYRDVYLQFMNPVHIATNDYASSGVYIRTPEVNNSAASVEITTLLTNDMPQATEIRVENIICDADGKEVKKTQAEVKLAAGETKTDISKKIKIDSPRLWDIDDPYRYMVYTRILDKRKGTLLDEVVNPLGLRWFKFDSEKGFFLNGKGRKLIGTARHQDYFQKGNALRDELHVQDVLLLKEMGGNYLRVSHYPQDPVIMEMCDKLGIVTSVEIPVVNAVTETEEFLHNSVEMAKEMVRQDFNRPSVMIWGYMNEIFLRRPYTEGKQLEDYYRFTEKVARALEATIREEDPSRYTMMAYHNMPQYYEDAHLTEIPMIQGWNLYQGWYEPDINEFQRLLDRAHKAYKGKVLMITEYGPGVDPRVHSYQPERFDFSQEYGLVYHKHYLNEMMKRPFVAGSSLWNLNDFYSESRVDAVPHVNNKGVVGLNREKKDVYWFYKTALSRRPILVIGNREWKSRGGVVNTAQKECIQSVPVFSNAEEVELFVNNKSLGKKKIEDNYALFDVPFVGGENLLEAVAVTGDNKLRDMLRIQFQLVGSQLKDEAVPFTEINVMLGSPRYFEDRAANVAWIPEQEYKPGSWGFIGGTSYRRQTGFGTMLGSDIDIHGTDMNPIFQTQRVGIKSFKADVPNGEYSVYLHWAELESDKEREALVYNLGADSEQTFAGNRSFGISINGTTVSDDFNVARDYGYARAVIKKFVITVKDGKGVSVDFHKKEGEPILNAIRIYRNY